MVRRDVGFKKTAKKETDYGTGAHRDNRRGKGAFAEMPWNALFLVSRIYEDGNAQRGWRNWENGMPVQDLLESGIRHGGRYIAGHRMEPHLSQTIWNFLNALEMAIRIEMGWASPDLYKLPNHFGPWKPGDPPPTPLSPQEREWLKIWGLEVPIKNLEQFNQEKEKRGRSNRNETVGALSFLRKTKNPRPRHRR